MGSLWSQLGSTWPTCQHRFRTSSVGSSIPRKTPPHTGCFVGQIRYSSSSRSPSLSRSRSPARGYPGSRAQDGVTDGESKGERRWNVVYANYGGGVYHCWRLVIRLSSFMRFGLEGGQALALLVGFWEAVISLRAWKELRNLAGKSFASTSSSSLVGVQHYY